MDGGGPWFVNGHRRFGERGFVVVITELSDVERRDFCWRAGKRWAMRAAGETSGILMWAVCVAEMVSPLGSVTLTGSVEICGLMHGLAVERKWPVQPVSAMARWVARALLG